MQRRSRDAPDGLRDPEIRLGAQNKVPRVVADVAALATPLDPPVG